MMCRAFHCPLDDKGQGPCLIAADHPFGMFRMRPPGGTSIPPDVAVRGSHLRARFVCNEGDTARGLGCNVSTIGLPLG